MFSKNLSKFSSFALKSTPRSDLKSVLKNIIRINKCSPIRCIGNKSNFKYEVPPLMDFDPKDTQFPNMIPFQSQFYFSTFVDKTFKKERFVEQTKQFVSSISSHLANDNIEGIKTFVTKEAFEEISQNFKNFTKEQKERLRIDVNDIQQCFPLGIRVKRLSPKEFSVKIEVIIEVLNNASDPQNQHMLSYIRSEEFSREPDEYNMKHLEPLIDRKYVCIYQFYREYGPVDKRIGNWIVSKLAHFKNRDVWRLHGLID